MTTRTRMLASAALIAALAAPASAHHSRANFDFDRTAEFTGTVTEFSWRNPHVYAVVETTDENGETVEKTFEMNSTPVLMRFGWDRRDLQVGDHVAIQGHPDHDASKDFYYTTVVVKEDGSELWSWGEGVVRAPQAPVPPSTDLTGVWTVSMRPGGNDVLGLDTPDDVQRRTDLPLNAAGQAVFADFDPAEQPSFNCDPPTLPGIAGQPYPSRITRLDEDTLEIAYEVDNARRTVHLGMEEHPAELDPSPLGHSIGRYEDDGVLVIDTIGFAPATWGHGQAVDSSAQKHVVERLELIDGGRGYRNTMTIEDPEYLTGSYERVYEYSQFGNYELADYTCDVETAQRHLTAGEE